MARKEVDRDNQAALKALVDLNGWSDADVAGILHDTVSPITVKQWRSGQQWMNPVYLGFLEYWSAEHESLSCECGANMIKRTYHECFDCGIQFA